MPLLHRLISHIQRVSIDSMHRFGTVWSVIVVTALFSTSSLLIILDSSSMLMMRRNVAIISSYFGSSLLVSRGLQLFAHRGQGANNVKNYFSPQRETWDMNATMLWPVARSYSLGVWWPCCPTDVQRRSANQWSAPRTWPGLPCMLAACNLDTGLCRKRSCG